jgi:branched-chain amino acid transport system ATP-binding protein
MIEISQVCAGYGSINILWDLSLAIGEGELTCIIGPNGAGKTTLLRAIMGLVPVTKGEITIGGRSLAGQKTWDMARQGVVLIPEGRLIFKEMTVEENLIMGAFPREQRPRAKSNLERIYDLFPRLLERRTQVAGSLSGGESQMLAMGRGLMAEPKLILLDEPSLGLAPLIVQEIFAILARLKAEGSTIVLVEQNTHMAVSVADQVHLMQTGKVIFSQRAKDVNLDQLHNLYFAR